MKCRSTGGLAAAAVFLVVAGAAGFAVPSPGLAQPTDEALLAPGLVMTFHLVPVQYWDDPAGPHGHELEAGQVYLYRAGSYVPEVEGRAGEPILIPPGTWAWTAEAPGWVSTFTNVLSVPDRVEPERSLTVPVVPACLLRRTEDSRWNRLDRVDVVSLTESAVYPLAAGARRELWVPAGRFLSYAVDDGELEAIGGVRSCRAEEVLALPVPEPPPAGLQSLMVTARLPEEVAVEEVAAVREEVLAELAGVGRFAAEPPVQPTAGVWQGAGGAFFFLEVPAEAAREVAVRHPDLRTARAVVEPLGGSARELALGELRPRRSVEVAVDYRPAREHGSAELAVQYCGLEHTSQPAVLMAGSCQEPLERKPLAAGLQTYRFDALDDGQYLVSAVVDGEEVPGLGQEVAPFLDPATAGEPAPLGPVRLEEMEVHGRLLVGDEPVAGVVRLAPWDGMPGVPSRTAATDEDLEYHLYYFGRLPAEGEVTHFPEELQGEAPEDLPGLYCCFTLEACGEGGACRTFNVHSRITGGGAFDVELPGEERVEVAVVDAASGEPVPEARVLVRPSPAFHFYFGEVFWHEALGAEPDGLDAGNDGRVVWLPPNPGRHRLFVHAPGYLSGGGEVEVPAGGSAGLTVELEPESTVEGTLLVFEDDQPVAGGTLVAFDEEGAPRPGCNARVTGQGHVEVPASCERGLTYLLLHPRAALQTFAAEEVGGSGVLEAKIRPAFPPRVRLVDAEGEPLADVFVQLRLGGLTITPDDLAGAGGGAPFQPTTNAVGEVMLHGVDVDSVQLVEVSPWRPYEEHWVVLRGERRGVVEVVAEAAR